MAYFNELLSGKSLGEANQKAHNKFLAHHLRGVFLGKYTLMNRFVLGDPALQPFKCEPSGWARQSYEKDMVTITGPAEWTMVEVHPDQLKVGFSTISSAHKNLLTCSDLKFGRVWVRFRWRTLMVGWFRS